MPISDRDFPLPHLDLASYCAPLEGGKSAIKEAERVFYRENFTRYCEALCLFHLSQQPVYILSHFRRVSTFVVTMATLLFASLAVILSLFFHGGHCGSYLITAPSALQPGSSYDVSVDILNTTDVIVEAELQSWSYNGTIRDYVVRVIESRSDTFSQGAAGSLSFFLNETEWCNDCRLKLRGRGNLQFEETVRLPISSDTVVILVQTDKAIYKPGQTVRFRVVAVYPSLQTYQGDLMVSIKDPNSNEIKVIPRQAPGPFGVIEGDLELSEQPMFGDWSIYVTAVDTGDSQTQSFTVANYELPRFEITVELPPFGLMSERSLNGKVIAKYTFGQDVKGLVELHVGPDTSPDHCGRGPATTQISFDIDGSSTFQIPKEDIQRVMGIYENTRVKVTAFVTESATGVRLNGSSVITYYIKDSTLKFLDNTPSVFKPGLPYTAYIQATTPDGKSPPTGSDQLLSVYTTVRYELTLPDQSLYSSSMFEGTYPAPGQNITLPASGVVPVVIAIPDNATSIDIKATFRGVSRMKSVSKTWSQSNNFLRLTIDDSNIKAGDMVTVKVEGTEPIATINYEVIARGTSVWSESMHGNNEKSFTFDLPMTSSMAPVAHLLAYYSRNGSEIVADSVAFQVAGLFENEVSVGFNRNESQPAQEVEVVLTADPMSMVNVLAVDQSVLLLKSGNDITEDKVAKSVSAFDRSSDKPSSPEYALSYSSANVKDVFQKIGLIVLTDVLMEEPYQYRNYAYDEYADMEMSMAAPLGMRRSRPAARPMAKGRGQAQVERIRNYFPEAWLWTKAEVGSRFCETKDTGRPVEVELNTLGGSSEAAAKLVAQRPTSRVEPLESSSDLQEVERIRNIFPDTWLWETTSASANGTASVSTTVPDTITSWVVSAFATNPLSGLGVAPTTAKLKVFRPFFISLSYPSIVIRGEHVVVQATIFNYLPSDLAVTVQLKGNDNFKNIEINPDGKETFTSGNTEKIIQVRSNEQGVAYFPIRAVQIGLVEVEVTAQSSIAADGVRRFIDVQAEGAPVSYLSTVFVDVDQNNTFMETVNFTLPPSTVSGSERAKVKVSAFVLDSSLDGLSSLLQLPTGCGEQSIVMMAPTLYIAKYLKSTGQLSGALEAQIKHQLATGYQRQLTYQRYDKSFSAFGNNDPVGSTWLTALVARTFAGAMEFTYIDAVVIRDAVKWLIDRQSRDGSFASFGVVLDPNTQTARTAEGLTAYVTLTLLEGEDLPGLNQHDMHKMYNASRRALQNLERQIVANAVTDQLSLSIVSYALSRAQSPVTAQALAQLNSMATSEGPLTYWDDGRSSRVGGIIGRPGASSFIIWHPPVVQARPVNIMTTSYAILAMVHAGRPSEAFPSVRWLISQRNPNGGFSSTQDTIVALEALSAFSATFTHPDSNLSILVTGNDGSGDAAFTVNSDNMLNLQVQELSSFPISTDITATGMGFSLVEMVYSFNVLDELSTPSFDVSTVLLDDDIDSFNLMICTKWLWERETGMVVQEISIPTGFSPDLTTLGIVAGMQKAERKGNTVAVYFDKISRSSLCYSLVMTRTAKIANSQRNFVRTFDYYQPSDQSTVFYHPRKLAESTVCDVCDGCCL
ncbi:hypothetical protein RRG08_048616 [Elysia crispata]|uniref:CD109 antigen n=1 Tax=Elysia crispata TaxID=231223 RepID=A0AAE1ADY2_9GAST|nr:hypothetical protein RRG08_048616 [Elysia crispata]